MIKNIVKFSLNIATLAHKGQYRKDGITPYITHPIAVAKSFRKETRGYKWRQKDTPKILESICLLHDVIEDTKVKRIDLVGTGLPLQVIDAVCDLTHGENESYLDYILRIKKGDRYNVGAKMVKVLDIKHNLSTLDPLNKHQRDKYLMAIYILEN